MKEERANLTAPLNDTETEIYGQSTNGTSDRSIAGRIDALAKGHYYRDQIYASFLHHSAHPTLLFYYSCSERRATKAPIRTHGGHNSLRRRGDVVPNGVLRCTESLAIVYLYRWSRARYDFIDDSARNYFQLPVVYEINLKSIFLITKIDSNIFSANFLIFVF